MIYCGCAPYPRPIPLHHCVKLGYPMKSKPTQLFGIFSLLIAVALFAGCGKKEDSTKEGEGKEKSASQVAAKVNTEEITVHQINSVLSRTPNLPPNWRMKPLQGPR